MRLEFWSDGVIHRSESYFNTPLLQYSNKMKGRGIANTHIIFICRRCLWSDHCLFAGYEDNKRVDSRGSGRIDCRTIDGVDVAPVSV